MELLKISKGKERKKKEHYAPDWKRHSDLHG